MWYIILEHVADGTRYWVEGENEAEAAEQAAYYVERCWTVVATLKGE